MTTLLLQDDDRVDAIAREVVARQLDAAPDLAERYGAAGRRHCLEDARYHLRYLASAARFGNPEIFHEYARWGASVLESRGIRRGDLDRSLRTLRDVLEEQGFPEGLLEIVEGACERLASERTEEEGDPAQTGGLAADLLRHLLDGRRAEAFDAVERALDGGLSIADLYLGTFQTVLHEVGRLWQTNRVSVAHEHYCTAAIQVMMARLYPRIFATPVTAPAMVASCAPGERHQVGLRMVADLFQLAGWESHYLGADTPRGDLLRFVEERRPRLLALSASRAPNLGAITDTIEQVRGRFGDSAPYVLVGGRAFGESEDLARTIGADGFATDAARAVELARALGPEATS